MKFFKISGDFSFNDNINFQEYIEDLEAISNSLNDVKNLNIIKEGIFTNIAYRISEGKFDVIKGLVNIANEVDEEEIRRNRLNSVKDIMNSNK